MTTPAWLERDGQLDQELSFASLIGSVYRRLSTLCALYGQYGLEDSDRYCGLAENAKLVTITEHRLKPLEWERHSWESNVRHPMKGLVGHVRYASPAAEHLIPFVPILRMAEITHVGKSTSFGLGQIRVTEKLGSRPPAKGPPV
ncbi:CRISPR system precrRNA processing endoribonuclease RAMP protein Cas6 [Haliangium sp. UPWRP_2]|uniref:CRISPR system precrRNA processing endoribonuclease RAMP protein Cas6 n=1 Tax=Haliangium sp. UPWRP_2 TaxID=1931276 RepID=UPI001E386DA8|nr:CRISPR system precrRNA processing endoribonuclease RAMP protein Cas6 [Haliangium sp. UPWRP_2]